jgi:hypothetical protein
MAGDDSHNLLDSCRLSEKRIAGAMSINARVRRSLAAQNPAENIASGPESRRVLDFSSFFRILS